MWFLAFLFAKITNTTRYFPEVVWSGNSWTHNSFRMYEMVVGRKVGIRREVSTHYNQDTKKHIQHAHTFEAKCALFETSIRAWCKYRIPLKVHIPILITPIGIPIFASPYIFTIALDVATAGDQSGGTSLSWTHTCTGSNLVLLVDFQDNNGSLETITATYNGVSTTLVGTGATRVGAGSEYIHMLTGPATGANTLAATLTSGGRGDSVSYSGVSQGSYTNFQARSNVLPSPVTATLNGVATGSWTHMTGYTGGGGTFGADTGTTIRINNIPVVGDSNGPVSGTTSLGYTTTGGVSGTIVMVEIPIANVTAVINNLTLLGVGA